MLARLQELYPNRITIPNNTQDLPKRGYMVYVLVYNNYPIVVGHGQMNRAKVIFDGADQITPSHLKALFVRLYRLYGNGDFARYIVLCENKEEAKVIEKNLHQQIGGNTRNLPEEIRNQLFVGLDRNSTTYLLLEIALRSSFDGLSDIRKWRADGLIIDAVWEEIANRLLLE
jgi:hypothetical protein